MSRIRINTDSLWDLGKELEKIQSGVCMLADSLKSSALSLNIVENILQWSDERIKKEASQMRDQAYRCGMAASYLFKMAESYEAAERTIANALYPIASAIQTAGDENAAAIKELIQKQTPPVNYTKASVKITESGQVVDSFNGVDAVYVKESSDRGEYCCARLVSKYYEKVYGVQVSGMFTGKKPNVDSGQISVVDVPQVGDIGYQTNTKGKGHWFIVKAVNDDGTYTVIEQNWKYYSNSGEAYCTVNRRVSYDTTSGLKFYHWSKN